jgi:hypothetical protein
MGDSPIYNWTIDTNFSPSLFKIFWQAMKRFETNSTPQLYEVLPAFYIIDDQLSLIINNGVVY